MKTTKNYFKFEPSVLGWARAGWYHDSGPMIRIAVLYRKAQILCAVMSRGCSVSLQLAAFM